MNTSDRTGGGGGVISAKIEVVLKRDIYPSNWGNTWKYKLTGEFLHYIVTGRISSIQTARSTPITMQISANLMRKIIHFCRWEFAKL